MIKKLQLGDKVVRGKVNSLGFVIGKRKTRDYRVIGVNPNLRLLEIHIKNGFEEVGKEEIFEWSITEKLRLLFHENHLVYSLFGGDWSDVWVGDF